MNLLTITTHQQIMKLKISDEFTFAVVSDIHLGSKRNPTEDIVANLNREFDNNAYFGQLDLLVLAGDVFDTYLSSIDVIPAVVWISRLIKLCKKHDVALRILEGTPSHDWRQSTWFDCINKQVTDLDADVRYIKDLSIWYEEKFDMNFLFVPDEWSATSEQTLDEVRQLLKDKGLEKVDYAYMHGGFEFQYPSFLKVQKHDSQAYLNLVKHLIFIGHIHTYSNFERIYAQGSFDRLSHGEEEPKGYLRVHRHKDGFHDVQFIENKGAKKFITVDCRELDLEKSFRKIEELTGCLPHGSFARIRAFENHPIFTNMDEVLKKFPHCKWSKDPVEIKPKESDSEENTSVVYKPIEITPSNVKELLINRILNLKIDAGILDRSNHYIDEMLEVKGRI